MLALFRCLHQFSSDAGIGAMCQAANRNGLLRKALDCVALLEIICKEFRCKSSPINQDRQIHEMIDWRKAMGSSMRTDPKPCLTVLDFIGSASRRFSKSNGWT